MDGDLVQPRGGLEQVLGLTHLDGAVVAQQLHHHAVVHQTALAPVLKEIVAGEGGETPVTGGHNLLAPGELELSTAQSLLSSSSVGVPATDRHENLADGDASAEAEGLAEGATHSGLKPISTGAGKHLVDAQHVEGVHTHAEVERILSGVLHHVLVARNAGSLKRLRGDVLLLPTAETKR